MERVDRAALQQLMWDAAGIGRDGETLVAASRTLACWAAAGRSVADLENRNLLDLARVIVRAAIEREESRGAHYRRDFPATSPAFARHLAFVQPVREDVHA